MASNLERFKTDLEALITRGDTLELAVQADTYPEDFAQAIKKQSSTSEKEIKKMIAGLPSFRFEYQAWYSEAHALIKQLLPDRLADFVRYYEKPKSRRELTFDTYTIEDHLQGISVTRGWEDTKVVGPEAAVPLFRQQLSILKSARARFDSSLFDIRQLLRADLFDSELEAARELAKNGFTRAAGALAGVVVEKHLAQVFDNHALKTRKKAPTINDYNDALKKANVIDVPLWRFIQHLADIRNLCDHDKKAEPTTEQVADLIAGVEKVIKTLF